jgi:sodium/potassium/calcium exchanger 6
MGFSACFGGPMMNMLLGVGLSGTYVIHQTGVDYPLSFSKTLLVTGVCLLLLLLVTIVFVPLNGYMLTRRWGIFLIACYLITMGATVVVELKGESS